MFMSLHNSLHNNVISILRIPSGVSMLGIVMIEINE
jgi:hypothetical protein